MVDEFGRSFPFDAYDAAVGVIEVRIETSHPTVFHSGDGGAVLAAIGCAGLFALVFKPTRYATTSRVYTLWGARLRGDEETDRLFDEGRW